MSIAEEVGKFLITKKKQFGDCACCGGIISAELIGKNYLHWYCEEKENGIPCENYLNPHTMEKCKIYNNGKFAIERKNQHNFIREVLITLMRKYKWANFIEEGSEIFKAIKSMLNLINIYETDISGTEAYAVEWKPLMDFDSEYPNWLEYEQNERGLIEVPISKIIGGNLTRKEMFNIDFSISYEYKKEKRYTYILEKVKQKGIKNIRKTLEDLGEITPICLLGFKDNGKINYFVEADGHRRVSIAKLFNLTEIKADVYELIVN